MSSFLDLLVFPSHMEKEFTSEEKAAIVKKLKFRKKAGVTNTTRIKIRRTFGDFDVDQNGEIDLAELRSLLGRLGEMPSEKHLQETMRETDTDNDGVVSFAELVSLMHKLKKDPNSSNLFVRKIHKAPAQYSGGMAYHSYSDDERMAFTEHINNSLASDPDVGGRLPMDPISEALFTETSDGLMLCKLINLAEFETIDARALNVVSEKRPTLSIFQKIENMNLALNAAKSIGCVVTNVNAKDIIDGNSILILGLIWQIIRIQLLSSISLTSCPELVCLLEDGEELDGLLSMQPEAILLRWFNYHLERSSTPMRVKNFGSDLLDGEALSVLLNQLDPSKCDRCNEPPGSDARARHIIRNAKAMGVETFIQPADITNANKKLLLAFCAQLFNTNPNLTVEQEVMEQFTEDFANLEEEDEGDTREEKVFRTWINSLGIDNGDLYINNLFADVQNGYAILKVMDRIQPGVVLWKRVNINPKNRYKKVENGNYVIDIAKVMRLTVVNVGGLDIIDGNHKLILAIMWQLMRRHTLNLLQSLSTKGKRIEDPQIVAWANSKVDGSKIRSFSDPSLSTGVFLLKVCHGIDRSVVNWDLVNMNPKSDDEKINNAKYAISVARKMGACVFCASEDIVQVMSRMIMLFCASLWHCENERAASSSPAPEPSPVSEPLVSPARQLTSASSFKSSSDSPASVPKSPAAALARSNNSSSAKEAQRMAHEETKRRIAAWKAERQIEKAPQAYATNAPSEAQASAQRMQEAAAARASREADELRLAQEKINRVSLEATKATPAPEEDSTAEVTQEEWDA